MADPFGNVDPADVNVLDYLGSQAPLAFRGQPALPVTGAAAVGTPQGPVGLAGGFRLVGDAGGATGPSGNGSGISPASVASEALSKIRFSDLAKTIFGTGPTGGAVTTPSGQLTTSAPEILRELQFPSGFGFAGDVEAGLGGSAGGLGSSFAGDVEAGLAGGGTEAGGAAAGALGGETGGLTSLVAESLGIPLGAAGAGLGVAGAVPGIVMAALSDEPNWEKAVDTALITAGAALAPETWGISAAVAGIADLLVHLFGGQQGDYLPKRQKALEEAKGGLGELSGVYQQAAQTGDPAQVLQALGTGEAGGKIRSELWLPNPIATELGLTGPRQGNATRLQWSDLTPQQFNAVLDRVRSDPSVLDQWVVGSGDVPYLPQGLAQQAADAAAQDARAVLQFMLAPQAAVAGGASALERVPSSPAAMGPGGGGQAATEEILGA